MKFAEFERLYPNYDRYRFSSENGEVRFLFNGDEYNPFNNDGRLVKTIYQFPSWNGHSYKPEDIRDFLGDSAGMVTFPKELMLSKTLYPVISTPFDRKPPVCDPTSIDIYVTPKKVLSPSLETFSQNYKLNTKIQQKLINGFLNLICVTGHNNSLLPVGVQQVVAELV